MPFKIYKHQKLFCFNILFCSSFILLISAVLENLGELVVVKHAILDRSLSIHLVNLQHEIFPSLMLSNIPVSGV